MNSTTRALLLALALAGATGSVMAAGTTMRIGVTPVILHDDIGAMQAFRRYLERSTGWSIEIVPRNSYRQTIDMVKRGELDFAWVSAFPYVYLRHHFKVGMVAMPLLNRRPTFRAYLIVPADDTTTNGILDLQGRVFAFADAYSHTGYVVPRYELQRAGKDARSFFSTTFFTAGHKNVVRAVASGLADGGSVDSFIWESLEQSDPKLAGMTRVVSRSQEFGAPPIVATKQVRRQDVELLRRALIAMNQDERGRAALQRLRVDGFVAGDAGAFAEVEAMMRATGDLP